MKDVRNRVHHLTRELNALLKELATVREEHACELVEEVLTEETVKQFKSAVDAMRRLLWLYIEAAAAAGHSSHPRPSRQAATLKRATEALRSLSEDDSLPAKSSAGSFIEKVEAIVERSIPAHKKR
jgi:acetylornithine deacetylase/succinyl-diaminopimelate desuccinylase-like protein